MLGVRLHPNFHGYNLSDPQFERLLVAATERNLLVQISLGEEDDRTQSAIAKAPSADGTPLAAILKKHPKARVQLLNAFRTLRGKPVLDLAALGVPTVGPVPRGLPPISLPGVGMGELPQLLFG